MPNLLSRKFGAAVVFAALIFNADQIPALARAIVAASLVAVWVAAEAYVDGKDFTPITRAEEPHEHPVAQHNHVGHHAHEPQPGDA